MGIPCPACSAEISDVVDSRGREGFILRRRKCLACENTFGTKETIAQRSDYVRPVITDSERAEMAEMYSAGRRVVDIASHFGRSTNTVYNVIKKRRQAEYPAPKEDA